MRATLAALLIIGVATTGAAAQSSEVREISQARSNPDGPILSIGLPLPRIGLPLPPTGLQPPGESGTQKPQSHRPGSKGGRRGGKSGHWPPPPVAVAPYFWPYAVYDAAAPAEPYSPAPTPAPAAAPEAAKTGRLYLDVEPASVQLFVDGYYVGTSDDVPGGLDLEAMPHRLEFRAQGYESLVLDVNSPADRVTTYRGALTRLPAASADDRSAAADAATRPAPTFYVIPGCYVGNVPPKDARLPSACAERGAAIIQP